MQTENIPVRIYIHCESTNEQLLLKFPQLPVQFVKLTDEARIFRLENPKWVVRSKDNEEYIVTCMRDILCLIEDRIIPDPASIHLYLRDRATETRPQLDETLLGYRFVLSGCPVHQPINNGAEKTDQGKRGVHFVVGAAPDQNTDLKMIEEAVNRIATQTCHCAAFATVPEQSVSRDPKQPQK